MTQLANYQPFATVLSNRDETPIDVLFRNLKKSDFGFKNLELNFNTGYPIDIYYEGLDTENPTLNFEFALPGSQLDDVQITKTKSGELRVRYDSKKTSNSDRDYYSRSISKRDFDLVWKVPKRFDLEQMNATFKNGLLRIQIPRSLESIPESVTIIAE